MDQNRSSQLLAEVLQRLQTIERRLDSLEQSRSPGGRASAPAQYPGYTGAMGSQLPFEPKASQHFEAQSGTRQKPSSPLSVTPELASARQSSGGFLGAVAVICFALAGVFIVKLAVDEGWLTPFRQIGLATMLGISLIFAGFQLRKKDAAYSGYLPAAGVIVLYMVSLASNTYLGLVPWEGSVLLSAVVSLICFWLHREFKHDFYAVSAAVGAYVVPLLANPPNDGYLVPVYFVLASITFGAVALALKSRTLPLVATYIALFCTDKWAAGSIDANHAVTAAVLAIHFLVFVIGAARFSLRYQTPLTSREAWAYFPALLFFYALEYRHLQALSPEAAPWISIAFAAVLILIQVSAGKKLDQGTQSSRELAVAFAAVVLLHSGYITLLPKDLRGLPLILIALGFIVLPKVGLSSDRFKKAGLRNGLVLAVAGVFVLLEYLTLLSRSLSGGEPKEGILAVVFAFCACVVASRLQKRTEVLLFVAHLQGVTGLYRLVENFGSLAVSMSWALYAALVLAYAAKRRDAVWARSSVIVLGLAAGKALLYDVSSAQPVVRILCLLLTGVVLYAGGWLFRRVKEWEILEARQA